MKVHYYRAADGDWRWKVCARNGRILAVSSEGYRRPGACQAAARKVLLAFRKGFLVERWP